MAAPVFLETRPDVLVAELIAAFETALQRTLYPAQLERILIDLIAYRESLVRRSIQDSAEQCLVEFSRGAALEALGRLVGVERLPAARARVRMRLKFRAPDAQDRALPSGWSVAGGSPSRVWRLLAPLVVPGGTTQAEAVFEASEAGSSWNGLPLATRFVPLEGSPAEAITLEVSAGGGDLEEDERLRLRILEAPGRFSAAGSVAAYRYHALTASPEIIDVAVDSPAPGVVGVYPLVSTGIPSQILLDQVAAALSADTVRPICDLVQVQAPERMPWSLDATLTLLRGSDAAAVLALAQGAAQAYAADRRAGLGRDLVGSALVASLQVPGVYRVALNGWSDQALSPRQWADATALALRVASERADG